MSNQSPQPVQAVQAEIVRSRHESNLDKFKAYAGMEEVQKRFANMLGSDYHSKRYIESVIIAVANSDQLQKCTPKSIMISAMRAASLQLSVDRDMKQAHLVPMGDEATLVVDYHGLVQLTTATGYYKYPPNVSEVYAGETVKTNRFTGQVTIEGEPTLDKGGKRTVIGWMGYFMAKDGTERWLYMTNEECDEHGKKYSRSYTSPKSAWNTDREKMRRKTVLRQLVSRWGHFSPVIKQVIDNEEAVITTENYALPSDENIVVEEKKPLNAEESKAVIKDLGFGG